MISEVKGRWSKLEGKWSKVKGILHALTSIGYTLLAHIVDYLLPLSKWCDQYHEDQLYFPEHILIPILEWSQPGKSKLFFKKFKTQNQLVCMHVCLPLSYHDFLLVKNTPWGTVNPRSHTCWNQYNTVTSTLWICSNFWKIWSYQSGANVIQEALIISYLHIITRICTCDFQSKMVGNMAGNLPPQVLLLSVEWPLTGGKKCCDVSDNHEQEMASAWSLFVWYLDSSRSVLEVVLLIKEISTCNK